MSDLVGVLMTLVSTSLSFAAGAWRLAIEGPLVSKTVRRTWWLRLAQVAAGVQAVVLTALAAKLVYVGFAFAGDDMLFILGLIFLPFALAGAALGLGAVGWLVSLIRRLEACDTRARVEAAIAAVAGLFLAGSLLSVGLDRSGLGLGVPSGALAVIAVVPAAWRREGTDDPGRPDDLVAAPAAPPGRSPPRRTTLIRWGPRALP